MVLSALAAAGFAVSEVGVGDGRFALSVRSRLGAEPGRPFSWLLDFTPGAVSTLHENNTLHSSQWRTLEDGDVEDVVASPGLTLLGQFVYTGDGARAYSTLSFGEMAAANGEGAYVCSDRLGLGEIPDACVSQARGHSVTCDTTGCWTSGILGEATTVWLRIQPGLVSPVCEVSVSIGGPEGPRVCGVLSTEIRSGHMVYDVGLGSVNAKLSLWLGSQGHGQVYVRTGAENPVELAGLAVFLSVAFVLWCEQTKHITALAEATISRAAGAPLPKEGVVLVARLLPHKARASTDPVFFGDVVSTVAFAMTLLAARHGSAPLGTEITAVLPESYVSTLSFLGVSVAWIATSVSAFVFWLARFTCDLEGWERTKPKTIAAWMLVARCSLEAACLIGVHQLLPSSELGEFPRVIGLFFGLVVMVLCTRDLLLVLQLDRRREAALLAILWAMLFQYASFAMILPAVVASSAVPLQQAVVYASTLGVQAAGAGMLSGMRKLSLW